MVDAKIIYKNKKINAGLCTTFNEYSILSENRLTKVKKSKFLNYFHADVCSTGIGCIFNEANVKPYQR